ncbi:hypothetical protein PG996_007435 [Apiospora saccharicola]|uniref:Uncharacterized protein n=1 Tax=Apiospora saccharicola TaxID=335842 RepID=A0ABR1VAU7_9PEZI
MASPTSSVLSQTLCSIAYSKTGNASTLRDKTLEHKDKLLTLLRSEHDRVQRLVILLDEIEACHALAAVRFGQLVLENPQDADCHLFWFQLRRKLVDFIYQPCLGPSASNAAFEKWETILLAHLDTMCARLQYDCLYVYIVEDWLQTDGDEPISDEINNRATPSQNSSDNRAKYRWQWEEDAFSPTHIDKHALHRFLGGVFVHETAGSNRKAKAMIDLSAAIKRFETELAWPDQFNSTTLEWVISSLLASTRLSQDKREALRNIRSNHPVLNDISYVVNSRMQFLDYWSWVDNVTLGYRPNANDKYIIDMEEYILSAIFLHYIGLKWSVFFNNVLSSFFSTSGTCLGAGPEVSHSNSDKQRHAYFPGAWTTQPGVQHVRHTMYREKYLVNRLLDKKAEGAEGAEAEMKRVYTNEKSKSETKVAEILLAESVINIRLHGEFTVIQSSFTRWDDLLPHASVLEILDFMGVSCNWLMFFKTFLEAPLRFRTDSAGSVSRKRRRGVPDSHVLSDVFSEVVLFCLDCAVSQATGGRLLYRSSCNLWFWSPSEPHVVNAWATIQKFAAVTGTQLCQSNSGCVRTFHPETATLPIENSLPRGEINWGLLRLSPATGSFGINQDSVDLHMRTTRHLLRRELKSIFTLIQELNSQQERLFHLLGIKANCFGRDHVTMVLHAYASVERQLFQYDAEDRNVNNSVNYANAVEYLKAVLLQRFPEFDIPNAYLFFPTELGGLGMKSASVALPLIRDMAPTSPSSLLDKFQVAGRKEYCRPRPAKNGEKPAVDFDEYKQWRREHQYGYDNELVDAYRQLLESTPMDNSLYDITGIDALLSEPHGRDTLRDIASGKFPGIGSYWRRIILLYGQEAMEKFGSLKLVDMELLPMGTLNLSKERRSKEGY